MADTAFACVWPTWVQSPSPSMVPRALSVSSETARWPKQTKEVKKTQFHSCPVMSLQVIGMDFPDK